MNSEYLITSLCEAILIEIKKISKLISNDELTSECLGPVSVVKKLLGQLYEVELGENEFLQRIVVEIESHICNSNLNSNHIKLVREFAEYVRVRPTLNKEDVDYIFSFIEDLGLNIFQGTLSHGDPSCNIIKIKNLGVGR